MSTSQNKTIPTKSNVGEFISQIDDEQQRRDSESLIAIMQKISGLPPVMWGPSIVGFGSLHYKYASGREGDMPQIAFSPRKGKLTLYVTDDASKHPELLQKLGKHSVSKACIYITRLSDVDMPTLTKLIEASYLDSARMF